MPGLARGQQQGPLCDGARTRFRLLPCHRLPPAGAEHAAHPQPERRADRGRRLCAARQVRSRPCTPAAAADVTAGCSCRCCCRCRCLRPPRRAESHAAVCSPPRALAPAWRRWARRRPARCWTRRCRPASWTSGRSTVTRERRQEWGRSHAPPSSAATEARVHTRAGQSTARTALYLGAVLYLSTGWPAVSSCHAVHALSCMQVRGPAAPIPLHLVHIVTAAHSQRVVKSHGRMENHSSAGRGGRGDKNKVWCGVAADAGRRSQECRVKGVSNRDGLEGAAAGAARCAARGRRCWKQWGSRRCCRSRRGAVRLLGLHQVLRALHNLGRLDLVAHLRLGRAGSREGGLLSVLKQPPARLACPTTQQARCDGAQLPLPPSTEPRLTASRQAAARPRHHAPTHPSQRRRQHPSGPHPRTTGPTHLHLLEQLRALGHVPKHSVPPVQQVGARGGQLGLLRWHWRQRGGIHSVRAGEAGAAVAGWGSRAGSTDWDCLAGRARA